MVANITTLPSSHDKSMIRLGKADEFPQLVSGLFGLDGNELLIIDTKWFPIQEFRFYCYKPSHNRTLHLVTSNTTNGIRFREYLLGKREKVGCKSQCPQGFRSLPDDTSYLKSKVNNLGPSKPQKERLYDSPFFLTNKYHYVVLKNRINCDDYSNHDGEWKIYIR